MNANVSEGFMTFGRRHPVTAKAHMRFVQAAADESALDERTRHLAYLSVLCAQGLTGGIAFHVGLALRAGASRDEVASAALVGMPAVGLRVLDGYAAALAAVDATDE